jgi:orotidine-5'-phosphate decarboxylase
MRIWVALDVPSADEADAWMERLHPHRHFKVGLELFLAAGPTAVRRWTAAGAAVFLDLKLHDIPNTVAGAVRQARSLGVDLLTVHAAGGADMLAAAHDAADGRIRLAGVTVLTSLGPAALAALGVGDAQAWTLRLAELAADAGLDAVVASGREAAAIHRTWPHLGLVVPGVRPAGTAASDQVRVVTPAEASRTGATDLVVGRPVLAARDPVGALRSIGGEVLHAQ